jgi:hypothetical protein
MLVYKVEKWNVLILLQTYWDLEVKVSSKSFEFSNNHIWLAPLQARRPSWSLQLTMQSVPITTDVVLSNLDQGEVYNIMW